MAYEAEPLCFQPDRIAGQRIKELPVNELACRPEVSPTSSYQEIIQGKNMSLVCTITATPMASITWWYKGLLINNGSTMVSDIDLRLYYYKNVLLGQETLTSELVLVRTSVDDNGTFQCIAQNRAGVAVANFSLNVVIPVPPKPPQDVVQDRFQQEYVIAIGIAGVIVSILTTVIVILVAIKCRSLYKSRRRQSLGESKIHLYQNSSNGSNMSEANFRTETPRSGSLQITEDLDPYDRDLYLLGDSVINPDSCHLMEPDLLSHTMDTKQRKRVISVQKVNKNIFHILI